MPKNKINWSAHVQPSEGPKFVISTSLDVTTYEVVAVPIDNGKTVPVNIGAGGDDMVLLLIQSDFYSDKLTYTVGTGTITNPAPTYKLEGPHMLCGPGATTLILSGAQKISFANNIVSAPTTTVSAPVNVMIKILVGRVPTPIP